MSSSKGLSKEKASERFERSIQEWYDKSRVAGLDYLNLETREFFEKESTDNCKFFCHHTKKHKHICHSDSPQLNFIADCVVSSKSSIDLLYDRHNLLSRVTLRHFHSIEEELSELRGEVREKQELERALTKKAFADILKELEAHKPLTKSEVVQLVEAISQQPKLVEKQALAVVEKLNSDIAKVEQLINEVKALIGY